MSRSGHLNRAHPIYPLLESRLDAGFARLAGAGLGNSLLTYFEAYLYSRTTGGELIQPAWPSIKLGPLLRGERSNRFYADYFRPGLNEVSGLRKAALLKGRFAHHQQTIALGTTAEVSVNGKVDVVRSKVYSFANLLPHRAVVRTRFGDILRQRDLVKPDWRASDYVAVHVRLGDFAIAPTSVLASGETNNLRIPLTWYTRIIATIADLFPSTPIHIFSDGDDADLADLLIRPNVHVRREGSDLAELIALAGARILVGSRSTFSYWAAYLGDMPGIWYRTHMQPEQLSSDPMAQILVGENMHELTARLRGTL